LFEEQPDQERDQRNQLKMELVRETEKFIELSKDRDHMKWEYDKKLDENLQELSNEKDQRIYAENKIEGLIGEIKTTSESIFSPR
jgi:hypothetical protein